MFAPWTEVPVSYLRADGLFSQKAPAALFRFLALTSPLSEISPRRTVVVVVSFIFIGIAYLCSGDAGTNARWKE